MLTDRITLPNDGDDPEDILSSSLGVIFPDDITNQHGDPSTSVIYTSPQFGAIRLSLADPRGESSIRLFSHHLWNSGVQLAALIEDAFTTTFASLPNEASVPFSVVNESVLELGAGTGLAGLLTCRMGAKDTVISDYPAPEVLANIGKNIEANIPEDNGSRRSCRMQGHEWGKLDPARDAFVKEGKGKYGRVLVADCLWMPWQHENLAASIEWFLADEGRAWVVAGFHTGRAKVAHFFEGVEKGWEVDEDGAGGDVVGDVVDEATKKVVRKESGLVLEQIWERDAGGADREWVDDRGFEDITGRKRWLVIAVLRKKTADEYPVYNAS